MGVNGRWSLNIWRYEISGITSAQQCACAPLLRKSKNSPRILIYGSIIQEFFFFRGSVVRYKYCGPAELLTCWHSANSSSNLSLLCKPKFRHPSHNSCPLFPVLSYSFPVHVSTHIFRRVHKEWHKKRELLKNPTKFEEIQEKKLLTEIETLQLAF